MLDIGRRAFITLLGGAAAAACGTRAAADDAGDRVYQHRFCPALGSARGAGKGNKPSFVK